MGASERRCRGGVNVRRPQRASARTNYVETRKASRGLGWPGGSPSWTEQWLTVAAAEQEGEPVQVLAQLTGAIGGVADEFFQRCAEAARVTGKPAGEELQQLSEFGRVSGV